MTRDNTPGPLRLMVYLLAFGLAAALCGQLVATAAETAGSAATAGATAATSAAAAPASSSAAPAAASALPSISSAVPGAATAVAPAPGGRMLRADWYVITYEGDKIGYTNVALQQLEPPSLATYRLEVKTFLRPALDDPRPGVIEESVMEMDRDWTARNFTFTRRGLGVAEIAIRGRLADGKLEVTSSAGGQEWTTTKAIEANQKPTFGEALDYWVPQQGLVTGRTFGRPVIYTKSGSMAPLVAFRVLQRVAGQVGNQKQEIVPVLMQSNSDQELLVFSVDGQSLRSESLTTNTAAQRVGAQDGAKLALDGKVNWRNRVAGKTGEAFASEVYGYKLTLPSYPYIPAAVDDGRVLVATNFIGHDSFRVNAAPSTPNDPQAAEKLLAAWKKLFETLEITSESKAVVDGLPAQVYQGRATAQGRQLEFKLAIIIRDNLGYLVDQVAAQPARIGSGAAFDGFLKGLSWSKVFGRERGHWNGQEYVSETWGYSLQLLAPGWRLPTERSGVPTGMEAVREDRAAAISVAVGGVPAGRPLDQLAAEYEKSAQTRVPQSANFKHEPAKLGTEPAVLISYEAKAIDNEPTESRHLLASKEGRLYILTLVTKKGDSAADNVKRLAEAAASFKFGTPKKATEEPKLDEPEPLKPGA